MAHNVKEWSHPECYLGATWEGWFGSGFGQTRDSDTLERSNFETASRELLALADELSTETHDIPGCLDGDSSVQIVREGHWAVGWVEWIAIHKSNTAALAKARELCERANDYPVLNEDHWSELEYTEAMDYWSHMSLGERIRFCVDCGVSLFVARRESDLPDRVYERLTN